MILTLPTYLSCPLEVEAPKDCQTNFTLQVGCGTESIMPQRRRQMSKQAQCANDMIYDNSVLRSISKVKKSQ